MSLFRAVIEAFVACWSLSVASQTAAPERRSVSTQLSMKTRQISLRSTGLWPFRWSSHAKKKSFFASTIMHICGGSCQGYLFLVFALKLHRHKFPAQIVGVCTVTFPLDSPMVFLQPTLVKRSSKSPSSKAVCKEEEDLAWLRTAFS